MNPKDGFDFNKILWSFLDQSRGDPLPSLSCSEGVTLYLPAVQTLRTIDFFPD